MCLVNQYRCHRLYGESHLWNDLSCAKWDVNLANQLTHPGKPNTTVVTTCRHETFRIIFQTKLGHLRFSISSCSNTNIHRWFFNHIARLHKGMPVHKILWRHFNLELGHLPCHNWKRPTGWPAAGDQPDPKGWQRHSTCRSLEECIGRGQLVTKEQYHDHWLHADDNVHKSSNKTGQNITSRDDRQKRKV